MSNEKIRIGIIGAGGWAKSDILMDGGVTAAFWYGNLAATG